MLVRPTVERGSLAVQHGEDLVVDRCPSAMSTAFGVTGLVAGHFVGGTLKLRLLVSRGHQ